MKLTLSVTALLLSSSSIFAADKPNQVEIERLSHNGSGCHLSQHVKVKDRYNKDRIHVDFRQFSVTTDASLERKNCSITLKVKHSNGWQFAVNKFDAWIDAELNQGAEATVSSNVYFQGESENSRFEHTWHGPQRGHFDIHESKPAGNLLWSSCGKASTLNTNTAVRVKDAWSKVTVKPKIYWNLKWRRC